MEDRVRRLIILGREHYNSHEYEKAEKYLAEAAAQLSPSGGFADVFNMLGVIYSLRNGEQDLDRAKGCFRQALRINASYTEAALNLAVTLNDVGEYGEAREVYQRALRQTRDAPRSMDPFARGKLANMHADVGAAYADLGLYEEAVVEYRKALELGPGFADLRTRLAGVLRDMGDGAGARHELELVISGHPRFLPARVALGSVLLSGGHREDAVREWEMVLSVDPDNKPARVLVQMAKEGPA